MVMMIYIKCFEILLLHLSGLKMTHVFKYEIFKWTCVRLLFYYIKYDTYFQNVSFLNRQLSNYYLFENFYFKYDMCP